MPMRDPLLPSALPPPRLRGKITLLTRHDYFRRREALILDGEINNPSGMFKRVHVDALILIHRILVLAEL
jgi:hypothetical protein